jgi:hypothetical protein
MKRLLLTLACAALLVPATAQGLGILRTQTKTGVQTSSRAATTGCSVSAGLADSLVLRCSGSTGYARAVYRFTLPSRFTGTPSVHTSLASGSARTTFSVDGTAVKVVVTRRGAGSARILMVSVSYYTR